MEKDLLQTIAFDLGITRYSSESNTKFNNRVIYSAIACWIKAASQDQPVSKNQSEGVSRRHIHDKCSRVLSAFLPRYHSSIPWFTCDNENVDAITLLRSRLLRHQELINVGFSTNVSLSTVRYERLSENLETIHGMLFLPGARYDGIALTRKPIPAENTTTPTIIPVNQWLEEYVKTAWWEVFDVSKEESLEYFDARTLTFTLYQCWQTLRPKPMDKYILVRRPVNVIPREYLLVDTRSNKMHRIDPVLKELNEHRRFMFALRAAANNPVPGQVTKYPDHVHLNIRAYLPEKETQLLEAYAWPHSSINDRLEWDMSIPVWNYISPFLTALGMAIREEEHG